MTDNEIIKDLQCASEWFAEHGRNTNTAIIGICDRALDLINRQNAEIERLQTVKKHIHNSILIDCDYSTAEAYNSAFQKALKQLYDNANAKSEAIKEFAERLKKRECSCATCGWCVHANVYGHRSKECDEPYIDKNGKEHKACYAYAKFESYIDNLVKEMVGEQE